jgi:hypothetical protein
MEQERHCLRHADIGIIALTPVVVPQVTRVTTMTMAAAAMTTTMLAAHAPILQAVHLPAIAIHRGSIG